MYIGSNNSQVFNQSGMQQPMSMQPVSSDQRNMSYTRYPEAEYYKEMDLIHERANVDMQKYALKRTIDEESIARTMMAKADLLIKKDMLSDEILIEEGRLRRRQEFMLETGKDYGLANFSIADRPLKLTTSGENREILFIEICVEGEKKNLYFDLARAEAGYYKKKFRNSGIVFKKRRKDGDELFFDVIGAITNLADTVELPKEYGFYIMNGQLFYADKKAVLWREVLENAK
ncbi:MAG: hypothetical protein LBT06_05010 [Hungatella sp.]|nr:hypothetical protein [Hungatella sp.]